MAIVTLEIPEQFIGHKTQIIGNMMIYNLAIYGVGMLCFALGFKFIRILIFVFFLLSIVNVLHAGSINQAGLEAQFIETLRPKK